jgi:undecaprenyl diphosphate synthase
MANVKNKEPNELVHLGVIMDGNRRWAKQHALSTLMGHHEGTKRFVDLCEWCIDEKIKYLTVYAFSTENKRRSKEEVDGIFNLMAEFFTTEIDRCIKNGVRLRIVGDRTDKELITPERLKVIEGAEAKTADCSTLQAQIAINYGGRSEILRAIEKLLYEHELKESFESALKEPKVDDKEKKAEKVFEQCLDTSVLEHPDIDLMIRTGAEGRCRLSGFFPWQTVYSEFRFLDVLWPDFSQQDLHEAAEWYKWYVPRTHGENLKEDNNMSVV